MLTQAIEKLLVSIPGFGRRTSTKRNQEEKGARFLFDDQGEREFDPSWLMTLDAEELSGKAHLLMPFNPDRPIWFRNGTFFLWRAVIQTLCHKRDTQDFVVGLPELIDSLRLEKLEELFVEGLKGALAAPDFQWPQGYTLLRGYLESLPGYSFSPLLRKNDLLPLPDELRDLLACGRHPGEQALEHHSYRIGFLLDPLVGLQKRLQLNRSEQDTAIINTP